MSKLLAGAAMRCVTPELELLNAMTKADPSATRSNLFTGVESDIYVRVIVASDGDEKVVMIGADFERFPTSNKIAAMLNEKYGIDPLACIFSVTHNHEAPFLYTKDGGDYDFQHADKPRNEPMEQYITWLQEQIVDAVGEAVKNLTPAKMSVAKGESFINANRDLPTPIGTIQANNFHFPCDHELLVIKFSDENDETIGMFVNFACHSNEMVWNVYDGTGVKLSSDLGGGISRFVEKYHKNKFPVIWAQGAAGDINPIVRSSWRIVEVNDDGELTMHQETFDYRTNLLQMKSLIATQGLEILELEKDMTTVADEFSFKGAETKRTVPGWKTAHELGLSPDTADIPKVPTDRDVIFNLRLANLCGVAFASMNFEAYTRLGMIVKDMMPVNTTAICTCSFGRLGYFADEQQYEYHGFGASGSNSTGAAAEAAVRSGFEELIGRVF